MLQLEGNEDVEYRQTPEMMRLVEQSIKIVEGGAASCIVIKNEQIIHQADGRGVSPLMYLYNKQREMLKDAVVVDKIIGKAAAMILVLGKVRSVYGLTMSTAGERFLRAHHIHTAYGACVDTISSRDGSGACPIERSVLEITDPLKGLVQIEQTIAALMKLAKK